MRIMFQYIYDAQVFSCLVYIYCFLIAISLEIDQNQYHIAYLNFHQYSLEPYVVYGAQHWSNTTEQEDIARAGRKKASYEIKSK